MVVNSSDKSTPVILPLENGDRLTSSEFERRYAAMPHLKKAESIELCILVLVAGRY